MPTALESEFNEAMLNVYRSAKKEAGYTATIFLQMVVDQGGLSAAKSLINSKAVSSGYTTLYEKGRLDLSVEAVVLDNPQFHALFTAEERAICDKRLKDYGYKPRVRTS
jgi:hypothetical protein